LLFKKYVIIEENVSFDKIKFIIKRLELQQNFDNTELLSHFEEYNDFKILKLLLLKYGTEMENQNIYEKNIIEYLIRNNKVNVKF